MNNFGVWGLLSWCNVWHTQCVILECWLKQMRNRTNVPNHNFKMIRLFSLIVLVSSISALGWSENVVSGRLSLGLTKQYRIQFRWLGITYRHVMCDLCYVEHYAMVIWSMVHRTHVPIQNFDVIVRYVFLCWVFQ